MTIIKSYEELKGLLTDFTYEDIGFEIVKEEKTFIEYYKKYRYRTDLHVRVNRENFESEVYSGDEEKKQGSIKKEPLIFADRMNCCFF